MPEMTVQATSDAANARTGEAFDQEFIARQPHTDDGWRQDWEKHSDGLMELFKEASLAAPHTVRHQLWSGVHMLNQLSCASAKA